MNFEMDYFLWFQWLQKVIVNSDYKKWLQKAIAKRDCKEGLQKVIAKIDCKKRLQMIIDCKKWMALLFRKDKNRIYFGLANQTLLTFRNLFWNSNPSEWAIISNNGWKGIKCQ